MSGFDGKQLFEDVVKYGGELFLVIVVNKHGHDVRYDAKERQDVAQDVLNFNKDQNSYFVSKLILCFNVVTIQPRIENDQIPELSNSRN